MGTFSDPSGDSVLVLVYAGLQLLSIVMQTPPNQFDGYRAMARIEFVHNLFSYLVNTTARKI